MSTASTIPWLTAPAAIPDEKSRQAAQARQKILTKPPGALGQLERIAIRLAALQGTATPHVEQVHITVFAADHGIAAEGVSAFPQVVTAEMLKNFSHGGAAICVAARAIDANLEVINLGTAHDTGPLDNVKNYSLGLGTSNFSIEAAMTEHQVACALNAGRQAAERAKLAGAELFIGGEMGIANTSAATTLVCILLNESPVNIAGPGTGLDSRGIAHKVKVIQRALDLHKSHSTSPLEALRRVGGFEIAALAGAYIACAKMAIPVLVDGFISSSAALVAVRLCPGVADWLLYSHTSAEPGHRIMLADLDAEPLLELGMRLGEGSGAAVAIPLLRMACALHNDMATFAEAEVSDKS
ncbi:Nicotinate-nucleotide--dimethylbenzimidazole phosphoribosyltransferase [hydrothermal vent metagenome]|uniref:Nicotinate-nucleotide--dimethylbenzimidazole phosphoribosyltransferase n=1 Tax=hydrothermal vent metagenome TaxID=652676 RepID=A0A3B1A482_9ZZZZ